MHIVKHRSKFNAPIDDGSMRSLDIKDCLPPETSVVRVQIDDGSSGRDTFGRLFESLP